MKGETLLEIIVGVIIAWQALFSREPVLYSGLWHRKKKKPLGLPGSKAPNNEVARSLSPTSHVQSYVSAIARRTGQTEKSMSPYLKLGLMLLLGVVAVSVALSLIKTLMGLLVPIAVIAGIGLIGYALISSKSLGGGRRTLP